jgi:DNA-binding transcriptional LysR family regulator
MNLLDINAFVAVAETGSVNRAAARLNLTQPATTRRIQSFEAAVGDTPLFDRAVKPAKLTSFGIHVLEHCRRVLAAVAELEACSGKASEPSGNMKVGVAHGLGEMVLTSPFDALRRTFPRLRLQVSSSWSTDLIEEVRSGALDCAVGLLTEAHSVPAGVDRTDLGPEEVVIVSASKPSTRPDGSPWRLRDLAGENWFLNPPGCGCRTALIKSFDRLQVPIQIAAEIFGEDLQLSLISSSGGLGLVPRRLFEHNLHRYALNILAVQDFTMRAHVALLRMTVSKRFDSALDLLVSELRGKLQQGSEAA